MRILIGSMVFTLAAGLAAGAEAPAPNQWIQGKVGVVIPDSCHCLKDTTALGLGFGTWRNEHWGLELDALRVKLQSRAGGFDAHETEVQGALLYDPLASSQRWKPYLRVGAGVAQVQSPYSLGPTSTTRLALHGAVGVQNRFGARGLASLEVRETGVETGKSRDETQVLLGLGFRWHGHAVPAAVPPPEPAPVPAAELEPVAAVEAAPAELAPAPAPEPVAATAVPPAETPVQPEPPVKIVLDDATLHFANNQAGLPPAGAAAVRQVAQSLLAYPDSYDVVVTGYASSTGSQAHNLDLSRRRAEAVARVLVDAGVPAARVRSEGLGSAQPLASNQTRQGQGRNRRVEIVVKAAETERRHTEIDAPEGAPAH
jgi:outer membrane protein OmpA-like peptidoglycan-associated protein